MLLVLHITVALASMGFTGYAFFSPSKTRLRVSQGFVVATLASGTYLVVSTHANIVQACATGLVYIAVVSFGIVVASKKLALESSPVTK